MPREMDLGWGSFTNDLAKIVILESYNCNRTPAHAQRLGWNLICPAEDIGQNGLYVRKHVSHLCQKQSTKEIRENGPGTHVLKCLHGCRWMR